MERIAPGPLTPDDATDLALHLLRGSKLACSEPEACAQALAEAVGNVAFYIHKLVSRLPRRKVIDPALIEATLGKEIADADNDWDLLHYRTRLPLYYGNKEVPVLHILDAVAAANKPLALSSIRKALSAQISFDDTEQLRNLMKLLEQDHYLDRNTEGHYAFRFPLIRRWWRFDRSL
jgi:hypothetical protein